MFIELDYHRPSNCGLINAFTSGRRYMLSESNIQCFSW